MSTQPTAETMPSRAHARPKPSYLWEPVSRVWVSVAICFEIAVLVLFNAFPGWIGVVASLDKPGTFSPILMPAFRQYLPLINAWLCLSLGLCLVHLGLRQWTPATRWADLGLSLFGCYVLRTLIHAEPLVAYSPTWMVEGWPLAHVEQHVVPTLANVVTVALWLALILTALGALVKLVKLIGATVRE
jgi:hypothetical protein